MRYVLALLVVAACGKNTEPPPPSSGSPQAQPESGPSKPRVAETGSAAAPADGIPTKSREMFNTVCAMCHGADGKGTGPAAASLNPKPRDYSNAEWQASVTDDELRKTIVKGGGAVGKSMTMPGNPQLESEPEVLDGLVKIIRGFKQ